MENIEQIAMQTYADNLKYFEENHPELFKDLTTLDIAINEGLYTEKYALEYKDGYFDVLELETNSFFYNHNSHMHAHGILGMYNTKRTGGIFKAQKDIEISEGDAEYIDATHISFHNGAWASAKILSYAQPIINKDTYMRRIYKMMFLGVGLGIHIKLFCDKFNPFILFIKESNLELFRLSLFVINFKELSNKRTLHFCIGANSQQDEKDKFENFLYDRYQYNICIKHVPLKDDYNKELRLLQSYVAAQMFIAYGHIAELLRFIDSPKYLVQNYSFLDISKLYYNEKTNIFSQKPILLLFSGPSTLKNIEWVQANKNKFIIISATSTCRLLNHYNIKPDIVVQIDPAEHNHKLFNDIDAEEFFKECSIVVSPNVHENILPLYKSKKIYMAEQGVNYKYGFGQLSAPTVGEYSYALSLKLGAKDIYMLGIDLALDENLQTHGSHHFAQKKASLENKSASLSGSDAEYIKGNFQEFVPVLSKFKISIDQFAIFSSLMKKKHNNVYNLSDGAYLDGAIPLRASEIKTEHFEDINKQECHIKIEEFLHSISEAEFNENDKSILRYQIEQAKILERKITAFKHKRFKDEKSFLEELGQFAFIVGDANSKRKSDLGEVFHQFFLITLGYIYEIFNTKHLENKEIHIKNIQGRLCTQLFKMSKLYISRLSKYLEE